MPQLTPHVPSGLIDLMKNLTKEVLRDKPENIYEFAAVYLEKLIHERDGSLDKDYEQFVVYEACFDGQQRFAIPPNCGFTCQRPIKIQPILPSKKSKSEIMAGFKAMESINEEDVLAESPYTDQKYQDAIYVIQRYYRRYVANKKKTPSSTLTASTAAIIIQRTMRRLFANKIKMKTEGDAVTTAKRDGVPQDDVDNVSEAASYTSSSTIQMLADSHQEGRENRLPEREEVLDGDGDEFKEQTTVAAQDEPPVAEEKNSAVAAKEMDRKSIADENVINKKLIHPEATPPHHRTATALDVNDTSTAPIGILSTKIGSNDQQNSLHTNTVEIDSNSSEPTQIKPLADKDVAALGNFPLNFPQSLGATPETFPATSPRRRPETQETFAVRLQGNAYAENNAAYPFQGTVQVRKFDPDTGESFKIYDVFYQDKDDPDFSDSLNEESTMERDSLENEDLDVDSLESNEHVTHHLGGILKREVGQDDGSLYEDTDEVQDDEEDEQDDVKIQRLVELERVPTYLYGIHPERTPTTTRKNARTSSSAESRRMRHIKDVHATEDRTSEQEELESKESTSEESSVTQIENVLDLSEEHRIGLDEDEATELYLLEEASRGHKPIQKEFKPQSYTTLKSETSDEGLPDGKDGKLALPESKKTDEPHVLRTTSGHRIPLEPANDIMGQQWPKGGVETSKIEADSNQASKSSSKPKKDADDVSTITPSDKKQTDGVTSKTVAEIHPMKKESKGIAESSKRSDLNDMQLDAIKRTRDFVEQQNKEAKKIRSVAQDPSEIAAQRQKRSLNITDEGSSSDREKIPLDATLTGTKRVSESKDSDKAAEDDPTSSPSSLQVATGSPRASSPRGYFANLYSDQNLNYLTPSLAGNHGEEIEFQLRELQNLNDLYPGFEIRDIISEYHSKDVQPEERRHLEDLAHDDNNNVEDFGMQRSPENRSPTPDHDVENIVKARDLDLMHREHLIDSADTKSMATQDPKVQTVETKVQATVAPPSTTEVVQTTTTEGEKFKKDTEKSATGLRKAVEEPLRRVALDINVQGMPKGGLDQDDLNKIYLEGLKHLATERARRDVKKDFKDDTTKTTEESNILKTDKPKIKKDVPDNEQSQSKADVPKVSELRSDIDQDHKAHNEIKKKAVTSEAKLTRSTDASLDKEKEKELEDHGLIDTIKSLKDSLKERIKEKFDIAKDSSESETEYDNSSRDLREQIIVKDIKSDTSILKTDQKPVFDKDIPGQASLHHEPIQADQIRVTIESKLEDGSTEGEKELEEPGLLDAIIGLKDSLKERIKEKFDEAKDSSESEAEYDDSSRDLKVKSIKTVGTDRIKTKSSPIRDGASIEIKPVSEADSKEVEKAKTLLEVLAINTAFLETERLYEKSSTTPTMRTLTDQATRTTSLVAMSADSLKPLGPKATKTDVEDLESESKGKDMEPKPKPSLLVAGIGKSLPTRREPEIQPKSIDNLDVPSLKTDRKPLFDKDISAQTYHQEPTQADQIRVTTESKLMDESTEEEKELEEPGLIDAIIGLKDSLKERIKEKFDEANDDEDERDSKNAYVKVISKMEAAKSDSSRDLKEHKIHSPESSSTDESVDEEGKPSIIDTLKGLKDTLKDSIQEKFDEAKEYVAKPTDFEDKAYEDYKLESLAKASASAITADEAKAKEPRTIKDKPDVETDAQHVKLDQFAKTKPSVGASIEVKPIPEADAKEKSTEMLAINTAMSTAFLEAERLYEESLSRVYLRTWTDQDNSTSPSSVSEPTAVARSIESKAETSVYSSVPIYSKTSKTVLETPPIARKSDTEDSKSEPKEKSLQIEPSSKPRLLKNITEIGKSLFSSGESEIQREPLDNLDATRLKTDRRPIIDKDISRHEPIQADKFSDTSESKLKDENAEGQKTLEEPGLIDAIIGLKDSLKERIKEKFDEAKDSSESETEYDDSSRDLKEKIVVKDIKSDTSILKTDQKPVFDKDIPGQASLHHEPIQADQIRVTTESKLKDISTEGEKELEEPGLIDAIIGLKDSLKERIKEKFDEAKDSSESETEYDNSSRDLREQIIVKDIKSDTSILKTDQKPVFDKDIPGQASLHHEPIQADQIRVTIESKLEDGSTEGEKELEEPGLLDAIIGLKDSLKERIKEKFDEAKDSSESETEYDDSSRDLKEKIVVKDIKSDTSILKTDQKPVFDKDIPGQASLHHEPIQADQIRVTTESKLKDISTEGEKELEEPGLIDAIIGLKDSLKERIKEKFDEAKDSSESETEYDDSSRDLKEQIIVKDIKSDTSILKTDQKPVFDKDIPGQASLHHEPIQADQIRVTTESKLKDRSTEGEKELEEPGLIDAIIGLKDSLKERIKEKFDEAKDSSESETEYDNSSRDLREQIIVKDIKSDTSILKTDQKPVFDKDIPGQASLHHEPIQADQIRVTIESKLEDGSTEGEKELEEPGLLDAIIGLKDSLKERIKEKFDEAKDSSESETEYDDSSRDLKEKIVVKDIKSDTSILKTDQKPVFDKDIPGQASLHHEPIQADQIRVTTESKLKDISTEGEKELEEPGLIDAIIGLKDSLKERIKEKFDEAKDSSESETEYDDSSRDLKEDIKSDTSILKTDRKPLFDKDILGQTSLHHEPIQADHIRVTTESKLKDGTTEKEKELEEPVLIDAIIGLKDGLKERIKEKFDEAKDSSESETEYDDSSRDLREQIIVKDIKSDTSIFKTDQKPVFDKDIPGQASLHHEPVQVDQIRVTTDSKLKDESTEEEKEPEEPGLIDAIIGLKDSLKERIKEKFDEAKDSSKSETEYDDSSRDLKEQIIMKDIKSDTSILKTDQKPVFDKDIPGQASLHHEPIQADQIRVTTESKLKDRSTEGEKELEEPGLIDAIIGLKDSLKERIKEKFDEAKDSSESETEYDNSSRNLKEDIKSDTSILKTDRKPLFDKDILGQTSLHHEPIQADHIRVTTESKFKDGSTEEEKELEEPGLIDAIINLKDSLKDRIKEKFEEAKDFDEKLADLENTEDGKAAANAGDIPTDFKPKHHSKDYYNKEPIGKQERSDTILESEDQNVKIDVKEAVGPLSSTRDISVPKRKKRSIESITPQPEGDKFKSNIEESVKSVIKTMEQPLAVHEEKIYLEDLKSPPPFKPGFEGDTTIVDGLLSQTKTTKELTVDDKAKKGVTDDGQFNIKTAISKASTKALQLLSSVDPGSKESQEIRKTVVPSESKLTASTDGIIDKDKEKELKESTEVTEEPGLIDTLISFEDDLKNRIKEKFDEAKEVRETKTGSGDKIISKMESAESASSIKATTSEDDASLPEERTEMPIKESGIKINAAFLEAERLYSESFSGVNFKTKTDQANLTDQIDTLTSSVSVPTEVTTTSGSTAETSADFSSIGKDLDFFEDTISYLKSATTQLSSMDDLFEADKKKSHPDDEIAEAVLQKKMPSLVEAESEITPKSAGDLLQAAIIIQSAIRGFRVRKALLESGIKKKGQETGTAPEEGVIKREKRSVVAKESDMTPRTNDALRQAAIIIQSAIRGHRVRKALLESEIKKKSQESGKAPEESVIKREKRSLVAKESGMTPRTNDALRQAAIIIQSAIRGHRVRKALRECGSKTKLSDTTSNGRQIVTATDIKKSSEAAPQKEVTTSGIDEVKITDPTKAELDLDKSQIPVAVIHPTKHFPHPIVVIHLAEDHSIGDEDPDRSDQPKLPSTGINDIKREKESESAPTPRLIREKPIERQTTVKTTEAVTPLRSVSLDDTQTQTSATRTKPLERRPKTPKTGSLDKTKTVITREKPIERKGKTVKIGSSDETEKHSSTRSSAGGSTKSQTSEEKKIEKPESKAKILKSKQPSTSDLLERPRLSKSKREQFVRKGRSISVNDKTQKQNVFDLEAIKKELLSKKTKTPPQSGKKPKMAEQKDMHQKEKVTSSKKSQSKASKLKSDTKPISKESPDILKHSGGSETSFESIDDTIDRTKSRDVPDKEKKSSSESLDLFDSLKKQVDKLKNTTYKNSATMIQKTFRGYKTRKDLKERTYPEEGKESVKPVRRLTLQFSDDFDNSKILDATTKTQKDLEKQDALAETKLSKSDKYAKTETPDISGSLKKDADKLKKSDVEKSATTIQKTFRGYKTRKNLKDDLSKSSHFSRTADPSKKEFVDETTKDYVAETSDIFDVEAFHRAALQKPATTIQKTFRGYKTRKELLKKGLRSVERKEKGKETLGSAPKSMDKKDVTKGSRNIPKDGRIKRIQEEERLAILDSSDVEDFKKPAITIQKTFRGYKTRKELDSKREERERKRVKQIDNAAKVIQKSYKGYKTRKTLNKNERDQGSSKADEARTRSNDKDDQNVRSGSKKSDSGKEAHPSEVLEKAAKTIQMTYKAFKTRKALLVDDANDTYRDLKRDEKRKYQEPSDRSALDKSGESAAKSQDPKLSKSLIEKYLKDEKTVEEASEKKKSSNALEKRTSSQSKRGSMDQKSDQLPEDGLTHSVESLSPVSDVYDKKEAFDLLGPKKAPEGLHITPDIVKSTIKAASAGTLLAAASTIQKAYRDHLTRKGDSSAKTPIKSYSHGAQTEDAFKEAIENSDESSTFIGPDTSFDLSDFDSVDPKSEKCSNLERLKSADTLTNILTCDDENFDDIDIEIPNSPTLPTGIQPGGLSEHGSTNSLLNPQAIRRKRSIVEPTAPPLEHILHADESSTAEPKPQWYVGEDLIIPTDDTSEPSSSSPPLDPLTSSSSFEILSSSIDARNDSLDSTLQLTPSINSAVVSTSSLLFANTEMHSKNVVKQLNKHSRAVSANEEDIETEENLKVKQEGAIGEGIQSKEEVGTKEKETCIPQEKPASLEESSEAIDAFSPRGQEDTIVTDLCKSCADGIHERDVCPQSKLFQQKSLELEKSKELDNQAANVGDTEDNSDAPVKHIDEIKHFVLMEESNPIVSDSTNKDAEKVIGTNGNKNKDDIEMSTPEKTHKEQSVDKLETTVISQMSNIQSVDDKIEPSVFTIAIVEDDKQPIQDDSSNAISEYPAISFLPPSSEDEMSDRESTLEPQAKSEPINVDSENDMRTERELQTAEHSIESNDSAANAEISPKEQDVEKKKDDSGDKMESIDICEKSATVKHGDEKKDKIISKAEDSVENVEKKQNGEMINLQDVGDVTPIVGEKSFEKMKLVEETDGQNEAVESDVIASDKKDTMKEILTSEDSGKAALDGKHVDKDVEEISKALESIEKEKETEDSMPIVREKSVEKMELDEETDGRNEAVESENKAAEKDTVKEILTSVSEESGKAALDGKHVDKDVEDIPQILEFIKKEGGTEDLVKKDQEVVDVLSATVNSVLDEKDAIEDLIRKIERNQLSSEESAEKSSESVELTDQMPQTKGIDKTGSKDSALGDVKSPSLVEDSKEEVGGLDQQLKNADSVSQKSSEDKADNVTSKTEDKADERKPLGEKVDEPIIKEEILGIRSSKDPETKHEVKPKTPERTPSEDKKSLKKVLGSLESVPSDKIDKKDSKGVDFESKKSVEDKSMDETKENVGIVTNCVDENLSETSPEKEISPVAEQTVAVLEKGIKPEIALNAFEGKHEPTPSPRESVLPSQEDIEIAKKILDGGLSDILSPSHKLEKSGGHSSESIEVTPTSDEKKTASKDVDNLSQASDESKVSTDGKDIPDEKPSRAQKSPTSLDVEIQEKLEKLIDQNLPSTETDLNTIEPRDLPTENATEEVVEKPCIKRNIPPTPLSAASDQDESELQSTTTKADSTTTTPGYDDASDNDVLDIPPMSDSLEAMTKKIHETEAMVARMQQRRASEHQISTDSVEQPIAFDEPTCDPIKPMQELQKSNSIEVEDDIILQKLQRGDTTRESSAQSESVIFGDSTSNQLTESDDIFNDKIDSKTLHRMKTVADERSAYKPPSHLFKSVTIDDAIKYIDPEKSTEESGGSFCMDDATSADVRKKMMAYSVSEADSDYYDPGQHTSRTHDDFNISTALDTFPSTDTDTTIISAATKIQAGARGFLTRRRLRRASVGTKSSLTEETKASFGNDAIGESLDQLVEEEVGKRSPKEQYHRQVGVNSLPSALGISNETDGIHSTPTREQIHAADDSDDLKLTPLVLPPRSTIKTWHSIDGQRGDNNLSTSSENDVNRGTQPEDDEPAQMPSNLEATLAARRLTLQRGDAMRNDSTPDDDNGNSKQVDGAKNIPASTSTTFIHNKSTMESTTTTTTTTKTEKRHYSDAATTIKMEKIKWFAMRQNSMPVQIDSEVFRVLPKHMRKRIKSAEGETKKRIRLPRD